MEMKTFSGAVGMCLGFSPKMIDGWAAVDVSFLTFVP
jgi:hypothetical protein